MSKAQSAVEMVDIGERAESVQDAILTRHSIRHFLPDEVPADVLQRLLETALRAPSWKNSQPWRIHVVQGATRERLAESLMAKARSGAAPSPDTPWPAEYPSDMRKRMFELGMQVYGVAGIERKDKAARDDFMLRNFAFFDAPVALFFSTPLPPSVYVALDVGCLLMTIMLLAREAGLGTCPQAALGAYPDLVRAELGLPTGEAVLCGMSLGYPAAASALNRFHTPREEGETVLRFYR